MFGKKFDLGFTLIELLIVVAIIAILAAIAIPNFLEAQTRAKVSRTVSDMRAISLGLESYRIDNNFIPVRAETAAEAKARNYFGTLEFLKWQDFAGKINGIGSTLTSPIAYLSDIPYDYFNTNFYKKQKHHKF